MDFRPDGRMLVMRGRRVLRREPDGALIHADLNHLSRFGWNESVVDGRGNDEPCLWWRLQLLHLLKVLVR
jgi:hypothetical protein